MERKPAYSAHTISVIIPALLLAMFMLRSHFCREWFPEMITDSGEWDGSNTFTMNVFSVMFMLSFCLIPFYKRTLISAILIDILIGICVTDTGDRIIFHIMTRMHYDFVVFLITIFIIFIDQIVIKKYGRKSV